MKFNKLVPELAVSDFSKSLDFYKKVLGFKIEYQRENFAFLSFNGSQIMIEKTNDTWKTGELEHPFGRGINFQIEVPDIETIMQSLKKANIDLFREPKDNWYKVNDEEVGCREFLVLDPDGYLLRFSQNIGSRKINE